MAHTYPEYTGTRSTHYVALPGVAEIVNLAIHLKRPLLVEGEAGCGKTRLAAAIAEELKLGRGAFFAVTAKSTSQARDLLYRYDSLRRLQESQNPTNTDARHVYPYIDLEPLGEAIRAGRPSLILIDEIDKADIDYPNDLLDVLDRFEFDIEDLPRKEDAVCQRERGFGRRVALHKDGATPILVLTSNREKQLPEPFLRRCLYVHLQFPTDERVLQQIVRKNLGRSAAQVGRKLIADTVSRFVALRTEAQADGAHKPPATSELVDWVRALHRAGRDPAGLSAETLTEVDRAVLFKVRQDVERLRERASVVQAPGGR
jgi:MoxR-like ATPase